MAGNETTAERVARIASKGLFNPEELTQDEIRTLCAAALTQVQDDIPKNAATMNSFETHVRDALIGSL
jgi:hypothetical protein